MAEKSLEERVDMLERGVEILEQLPERVTALEVQIVNFATNCALSFLQRARRHTQVTSASCDTT